MRRLRGALIQANDKRLASAALSQLGTIFSVERVGHSALTTGCDSGTTERADAREFAFSMAVEFDLDQLIREIGPFGKYQLINYLLICVPIALTAMYTLTYVFTGGSLEYRCRVPGCDAGKPPLSPLASEFLSFTTPTINGKPSQCQRYTFLGVDDLEGSDTATGQCSASSFDRNATESCEMDSVFQSDESTVMSEWQLTCNDEWKLSLLGTINNIGQFVCLPLTGFVSDRYGRRTAFVLGTVLSGLFGLIRSFSPNYIMFIILEFLEPAFGSGAYSSGFILGTRRFHSIVCQLSYLPLITGLELVAPEKRALGSVCINTFYGLGLALLGLLALWTREWRLLLQVAYAPCLLFVAYFWLIPESLRWLVTKHRLQEAKNIVRRAGKMNGVQFSESAQAMLYQGDEEEYLELQPKGVKIEDIDKEDAVLDSREYPILKALKNSVIRWRLIVMSICWITTTFVYYGLSIYSVSLVGDKYLNFITGSLIEIPAFVICYFTINTELCGRKRTLSATFFISAVACFCQLALNPNPEGITVGPLILFLVGKCAITLTFTVLYIYTAELFPTELRHSLLGCCSMFGRIGSMVAPQLPLLVSYPYRIVS